MTEEPSGELTVVITPTVVITSMATPVPVIISHIAIRDAADGLGSMVYTHAMTVGEEFTVYAAGYDAEGNYLWDVPTDWSVTGSLVQAIAEPVAEEPVVEKEIAPEPEEEVVSVRNCFNHSFCDLPNASISVQLSASQITAQITMKIMSCNS